MTLDGTGLFAAKFEASRHKLKGTVSCTNSRPTSWQVHGLAFNGFNLCLLVALVVVLFVKRTGSRKLCIFWTSTGTVSTFYVMWQIGSWSSIAEPSPILNVVFQICLSIVCGIGFLIA